MSLVLLLSVFGILMIYSADQIQTASTGQVAYHQRQLIWLGLSLAACIIVSSISTRTLEVMSYWFYGVVLLALVMVLTSGKGVERWLQIPGTKFFIQPSELAKIATILALATYISNRKKRIEGLKDMTLPFIIIMLPAGLILAQPDLGTTIVYFFIVYGVLYWSGIRLIYLFLLISPIISLFLALVSLLGELRFPLWGFFFILLGILIFYNRIFLMDAVVIMLANLFTGVLTSSLWNSLKPYQQNRIAVFFQPELDPQGSGWQIIQSKVAIGSGGLLGKGFLQGTQKNWSFSPPSIRISFFPWWARNSAF